jgi:valyl-tRNA synthetase
MLESHISKIASDWPEALIVARWPEAREPEGWEESKIADFELVQEIVRSIRNVRAEKAVAPGKRIAATIVAGTKIDLLKEQARVLTSLAGLSESELTVTESLAEKPKDAIALVVGSAEIYLPLAGMVDLAEEKTRLEKELKETQSHIERLEKLLAGDFAKKAPAALVQKERDKLAGYHQTAEKIKSQLK